MNERSLQVVLFVGAALLCAATATAQQIESIQFTTIAETGTAIPGGSGGFDGFGFTPIIEGGTVAFYGQADGFGQQGIYLHDGQGLSVVVDLGDTIPEGVGNFTSLSNPGYSDGVVAFRGLGNSAQQGIYTAGTSLAKIADVGDPIPGGTGNFTGFSTPAISDGTVVLWGQGASLQRGLYLHDGTLTRVVDTNTPIPQGSGNFTSVSTTPAIDGNRIAFHGAGSGSQRGLYVQVIGGGLMRIVDWTLPIPEGTGDFINFQGNVGVSSSLFGFFGSGPSSQGGVYVNDGALRKVADRNTSIPGSTGTFLGFSAPAVSGEDLVFEGLGGFGFGGVYADLGDGPEKIIDTDDMLDGKAIERFDISKEAIDGTQIVFFVEFTNGSHGIYRADLTLVAPPKVPALTGWFQWMLPLALFAVTARAGRWRPAARGAPIA